MQASKPSGGKQPFDATFRSWWWFIPVYGPIYYFADPLLDWVLAHPHAGVALIGLASSTVFAFDALRVWRDDVAQEPRERMLRSGDGQATDLRTVYVIVAALVVV